MLRFIWDIIKQLPAPVLFAVSAVLGLFFIWGLAQLNAWGILAITVAGIIACLFAFGRICKREPISPPDEHSYHN